MCYSVSSYFGFAFYYGDLLNMLESWIVFKFFIVIDIIINRGPLLHLVTTDFALLKIILMQKVKNQWNARNYSF